MHKDDADLSLLLTLSVQSPDTAVSRGASITRINRLKRQLEQTAAEIGKEEKRLDRYRHSGADTSGLLRLLRKYFELGERVKKAEGNG